MGCNISTYIYISPKLIYPAVHSLSKILVYLDDFIVSSSDAVSLTVKSWHYCVKSTSLLILSHIINIILSVITYIEFIAVCIFIWTFKNISLCHIFILVVISCVVYIYKVNVIWQYSFSVLVVRTIITVYITMYLFIICCMSLVAYWSVFQ